MTLPALEHDGWAYMHFVVACLAGGALRYRVRTVRARPVSLASLRLRAVTLQEQVARMQRAREMAT